MNFKLLIDHSAYSHVAFVNFLNMMLRLLAYITSSQFEEKYYTYFSISRLLKGEFKAQPRFSGQIIKNNSLKIGFERAFS